jgi:hypothetical protein
MLKECGNSHETLFSSSPASFCPVLRKETETFYRRIGIEEIDV